MDIDSTGRVGGSVPSRRDSRRPGGDERPGAERLAALLGVVSLGLGAAELLAPRSVSRAIGIDGAHHWLTGSTRRRDATLRAFGAREIATGLSILTGRRPAGSLWARVAGDVLDLGAMAIAGRRGVLQPRRLATAAAAVAGIAALDVLCARLLVARRSVSRTVEADGALRLVHALAVNKPPAECFAFWRRLENAPRFMTRIESVTVSDAQRSHWVARGPAGSRLEWDAEITQEVPDHVIVWRSAEGAPIDLDGSVRFERGPRGVGTLVRLSMRYQLPGGRLAAAVSTLIGAAPDAQMREDLRRFKRLMETGTTPTTAGQPHGSPRGAVGKVMDAVAREQRSATPSRGRIGR